MLSKGGWLILLQINAKLLCNFYLSTKNISSFFVVILLLLQSVLLSGCSNGFHLRENVELPKIYQKIQLNNIALDSDFAKTFEIALEEAGGVLTRDATTQVTITNLREGKRVVAYTSERKARIYLVFLKFEYSIQKIKKHNSSRKKVITQRINLDRTFIYDANFALGKAEEEKQIRDGLYVDAARLIILRLHYTNESSLQ